MERGESAPSREILIKLSDIFKVSINEFLGGKMKKENECLTYQEELLMINEMVEEVFENEIKIHEKFEKIERKIKFHDIIIVIIMLLLMIIFIFWR